MNYTINVSLPKALADKAKEQVKTGNYSSVSEVVRDALRCLFIDEKIPTFKMSAKAEKRALQAFEDYKNGKAIEISSFKELE